ncbi:hypothetical protein DsansV1_C37g0232481 [Dioscorea sansibarensis]
MNYHQAGEINKMSDGLPDREQRTGDSGEVRSGLILDLMDFVPRALGEERAFSFYFSFFLANISL